MIPDFRHPRRLCSLAPITSISGNPRRLDAHLPCMHVDWQTRPERESILSQYVDVASHCQDCIHRRSPAEFGECFSSRFLVAIDWFSTFRQTHLIPSCLSTSTMQARQGKQNTFDFAYGPERGVSPTTECFAVGLNIDATDLYLATELCCDDSRVRHLQP